MDSSSPSIHSVGGEREAAGLKKMRALNSEFLSKDEGCQAVRDFLMKAHDDEALLLRFLIGRKYKAEYAWETLKRNAEVRFVTYPEMFQSEIPKTGLLLRDNYGIGVFKARDKLGRRVGYFDATKWDPDTLTMETLTKVGVHLADCVMMDEDSRNNGVIFVQDCSGMGMKHAKLYTVTAILRLVSIFWYSFPLRVKGIYYINLPYFLTFIYGIAKPFFPKKMKDRLFISPTSKKYEMLHELIPPKDLPKCFGGELEMEDAVDTQLFSRKF